MNSFRFVAFLLLFQALVAPTWATPLTASAAAPWKQDFTLRDYMNVYDFPEEQLSYPVEIPAGITPRSLRLLAFTGNDAHVVPFQLSSGGKGKSILFLRTDLPQGATRIFRLVAGFDAKDIPVITMQPPALQATGNPQEAVLGNSLLLVKVPAGHQEYAGGKAFSQAAAPILGLARAGKGSDPVAGTAQRVLRTTGSDPFPAMASGSFAAPAGVRVESMDAKIVESGPLFTTYRISYKLQGGKSYAATLELRANEPYVRVAEEVHGFKPDDQAFLRLNYGKGMLDPDRCLVATNGGYLSSPRRAPYSGAYGEHVMADGLTPGELKLNYFLGLYTPNAYGVMHATVFYRDKGSDALLLALNRLTEWKTYDRALWSSATATENLRFYSRTADGQKYMTAGLAGQNRFWVVGLIPRQEVKIPIPTGLAARPKEEEVGLSKAEATNPQWRKEVNQVGAGPEQLLFNQLNEWSLNAYKDRMANWPETLSAAPFDAPDFYLKTAQQKDDSTRVSFEDWDKKIKPWVHHMSIESPDAGGAGNAVDSRGMSRRFGLYAINRADWTQEQRDHARQLLLFVADFYEGDANEPHHSMMAGHPNFVMDIKVTLPIACATFPNHSRAKAWRDSFMAYYNEWLDRYVRKDIPGLNTKGGRWTENIACYLGQSLVGLEDSQKCLKAYDGTSLGQNPQLFTLLHWLRDSFMSPHDGMRLVPPEGAHSAAFTPGGRDWAVLSRFCAALAPDNPQLSAEIRWIQTNGKEGTRPDLHSALYTDYGPVFHHDFGGSHESYAHMQNINGPSYRWARAGIVYYGAKGKVWSFNADETNGDDFDWNQVSAFNVDGKGMLGSPTDQLLYDFDFAQFYRQPAKEGEAYRARGVMLLRDDYLVLSDEVQDPSASGTFNWVNFYDLPQIYQLKPGAPRQEKVTRDATHPGRGVFDPGHPDTRSGKVASYSGKGDFLTVVAPAAVKAAATPFGATVNGEYVFASQKPEEVAQGGAVFAGTYGYARPNQLALFQGSRIGLNGFELRREGGDFGLSAAVEGNHIAGRIVGRSGGKILVTLPRGMDAARASITISGEPVPHTIEQGALAFSVEIAQRDGVKNYVIQFGK